MLFYIFVICCICLYFYIILKKQKGITIIQTTIEKVHDGLLFEKYPIVIDSKIVSSEYLFETLFKYLYISKQTQTCLVSEERKVLGVYNIIHNENQEVLDVFVKNENDFVEIKLNPFSILIIPSRWYVKCKNEINIVELYDLTHLLFKFI
jgi:hypothetical protein